MMEQLSLPMIIGIVAVSLVYVVYLAMVIANWITTDWLDDDE